MTRPFRRAAVIHRMSGFRVPNRDTGETFAQWVERIGDPMEDGHDVVFQMPFVHDGMRVEAQLS